MCGFHLLPTCALLGGSKTTVQLIGTIQQPIGSSQQDSQRSISYQHVHERPASMRGARRSNARRTAGVFYCVFVLSCAPAPQSQRVALPDEIRNPNFRNVKMSNNNNAVYWSSPLGYRDDFGIPYNSIMIDGKTQQGPWANMTEDSWRNHGVKRFGIGYGQMYEKQPDGCWLKIEG